MWKAMLECHHLQYITISLAYHSRSSTGTPSGDIRKQVITQLMEEIECFGLSFTNWVNSLTSYVEALNGWLQHCILQPRERPKSRRPFSPRRVLAPPIFVLCRDWSVGIKALPSEELSGEIKYFLSDVHHLTDQRKVKSVEEGGEHENNKGDDKNEDVSSNLCCVQSSLGKVLDRLNKFSEASLKMYEDIKQKNEAAWVAYTNCRQPRF